MLRIRTHTHATHAVLSLKVFLWLGSYGGGSPKPSVLWSNCKALLADLWVPPPNPDKTWNSEMVTKQPGNKVLAIVASCLTRKSLAKQLSPLTGDLRRVGPDGNVRISGGCDLKNSQHYPVAFGRAVAEAWDRISDSWLRNKDDLCGVLLVPRIRFLIYIQGKLARKCRQASEPCAAEIRTLNPKP